jgi:phosphoribosyl-ATP pyrophosphohydrolase
MAKSQRKQKAGKTDQAKSPSKKVSKSKLVKTLKRVSAAPAEVDVLDRLYAVVQSRRDADPSSSHSARLLSRGITKVAQKFGEEAVECLIEAVAGNKDALIAESADVLYHLIVLWVSSGVAPGQVWSELVRREGISGIAEKAARPKPLLAVLKPGTSKIP